MRGRGSSMPIGLRSDDLALERVGADAFLKDLLGPFLGGEQAVVAVVAAAFDGGTRHVFPSDVVSDGLEGVAQGLGYFSGAVFTPGNQVETGPAAEWGAVDDAV